MFTKAQLKKLEKLRRKRAKELERDKRQGQIDRANLLKTQLKTENKTKRMTHKERVGGLLLQPLSTLVRSSTKSSKPKNARSWRANKKRKLRKLRNRCMHHLPLKTWPVRSCY